MWTNQQEAIYPPIQEPKRAVEISWDDSVTWEEVLQDNREEVAALEEADAFKEQE
jgi:hypothetical protein